MTEPKATHTPVPEIDMGRAKCSDAAKGIQAIMLIRDLIQKDREIQEGLVYGILHDRLGYPIAMSERLVKTLVKDAKSPIQRRGNLLVWNN